MARAEEVRAATGFPSGGVAPFPLPQAARVVVEQTLVRQPVVWTGGGSTRHLVRIAPAELLRLTRAETADVVQDTYDAADTADTKEP